MQKEKEVRIRLRFCERSLPAAVPHLVIVYDSVNVKLDECGGIQEAKRCIDVAKSLGMKTMLGCMVSISVGVTAAAHLSPLVALGIPDLVIQKILRHTDASTTQEYYIKVKAPDARKALVRRGKAYSKKSVGQP